jgi:bifunctional DNA-binding transcriptional regulator/antitoxin component of YhaV-PrlF toxin-antitoxin module
VHEASPGPQVTPAPPDDPQDGLQVTVPRDVLARLGWAPGAELRLTVVGDALVLRPTRPSRPRTLRDDTPSALRAHLSLSLAQMARLVGVPVPVLMAWEEGRGAPTRAQLLRLHQLAHDPEAALASLEAEDG